jgi:hypothetical protein
MAASSSASGSDRGESAAASPLELDRRRLEAWVEVLESLLPTDEGYDDDTEQVLGNVIRSMQRVLADA